MLKLSLYKITNFLNEENSKSINRSSLTKRSKSPKRATSHKRAKSPKRATSPKRAKSPKRATSPKRAKSPKRTTSPKRAKSPKRATLSKRAKSPKRATSPKRAKSPKRATSPKRTKKNNLVKKTYFGGSGIPSSRERNDRLNEREIKKNLANMSSRETTTDRDFVVQNNSNNQSHDELNDTDIDNALEEYDFVNDFEDTE
jgi:hypothetical protein